MYDREEKEPPPPLHLIGAGIGIRNPPIEKVPLKKYMSLAAKKLKATHLSIADARRRLALGHDVPRSDITIVIGSIERRKEAA